MPLSGSNTAQMPMFSGGDGREVTHWEHVLDTAERPVLLLATARHDLSETREDWGTGDRRTRLDLKPLSVADAGRVVDALLGDAGLHCAADERRGLDHGASGRTEAHARLSTCFGECEHLINKNFAQVAPWCD